MLTNLVMVVALVAAAPQDGARMVGINSVTAFAFPELGFDYVEVVVAYTNMPAGTTLVIDAMTSPGGEIVNSGSTIVSGTGTVTMIVTVDTRFWGYLFVAPDPVGMVKPAMTFYAGSGID